MEDLKEFLPLILPLGILQLGLQIFCLVDIWKFAGDRSDRQDKIVWTLVVLLFSLFGSLFYIIFERERR